METLELINEVQQLANQADADGNEKLWAVLTDLADDMRREANAN